MKVFVGLSAVAALFVAKGADSSTISVKGSDTMVILEQKWAEVYMREHPEVKIQVTGGGSGIGFAALQDNTTDLANASRGIKPAERAACIRETGKDPREIKVALDGLCVIAHASNPVKDLSVPQLKQIFAGRIKNWREVGGRDAPIILYSRENSSGSYEFFKEHVLEDADFAPGTQTMPGTAALVQAVAKDPNGIGYGGAAYARGSKILRIRKDANSPAIEPTEANVLSGRYPISRYLYHYLNPDKERDELAAYLKWVRGNKGQKIVREVGYYPLPAEAAAR